MTSSSHFEIKNIATIALITLFLFFSLWPFASWGFNEFNDLHRIAQIVLLASLFLLYSSGFNYHLYLLLLVAFTLLLIFRTQHQLLSFLHSAMLFVSVFTFSKLHSKLRLIQIFVAIFGLNLIACGFTLFYSALEQHALDPLFLTNNFDNIRHFNNVQVFFFAAVLFLFIHYRLYGLTIFLLTINFLLLEVTAARAASLSIFIAYLFCIITNKDFKETLKPVITAVILSAVLYVLFYLRIPDLTSLFRNGSSGRLAIWLELLNTMSYKSWLFGYGPGSFVEFNWQHIFGHPHNAILMILFQYGLPITVAACYYCWVLIKNLVAINNSQYTALLLALIAMLVCSLFDGLLTLPVSQTLACFVFGWAISAQQEEKSIPPSTTLQQRPINFAAALLTVLFYLIMCSQYYENSLHFNKYFGPNFWANGAPFTAT